jgi:hypothetical protein
LIKIKLFLAKEPKGERRIKMEMVYLKKVIDLISSIGAMIGFYIILRCIEIAKRNGRIMTILSIIVSLIAVMVTLNSCVRWMTSF